MRIESVRFDASGNAAIAVSGGISFMLTETRAQDFVALAATVWGLPRPGAGDIPDSGRIHGFLSALPAIAPEFGDEDEAYQFLVLADEAFRAARKALELCARAEQSSAGLSTKLAQRGFSKSAIGVTIRSLIEEGFLDDKRYALLWARSRAERRGEGPHAIAAALRARGIRPEIVRAALAEIDFSVAIAKAARRESLRLSAFLGVRDPGKATESGEAFRDSLRVRLKKQGFDPDLISDEIDKIK